MVRGFGNGAPVTDVILTENMLNKNLRTVLCIKIEIKFHLNNCTVVAKYHPRSLVAAIVPCKEQKINFFMGPIEN